MRKLLLVGLVGLLSCNCNQKEWKKDKVLPQTTIGGAYTICFTPTGIGDFVEVRCIDGTKLDLTEYDLL